MSTYNHHGGLGKETTFHAIYIIYMADDLWEMQFKNTAVTSP